MKIGTKLKLSYEGRRTFPALHRALQHGSATYLGESRKSTPEHHIIRVLRPRNKQAQLYWAAFWERA